MSEAAHALRVAAAAGEGSESRRLVLALAVVVFALSGCAVQAPRAPEVSGRAPSGFPGDFYQQSARRGIPVLEIDPAASLLVIEARRGGPLARLGHDHAIASHNVQGLIAPTVGRADLFIRLDELVVDEPQLRAEAGFDTAPTPDAIEGTRRNMLLQLHAEEHPYAVIAMQGVDAGAADASVDASITINGTTRAVRVAVHIGHEAEQWLFAGRVALAQSDFGIVPMAILGGGLVVEDRVVVRFVIRAGALAP